MADYRRGIASRLTPDRVRGARVGGLLTVAVTAASWGLVGILVRQLTLPAVSIAWARLGLAALTIAAFALIRPGAVSWIPKGMGRRFIVLGALMALNWWLFIAAFQLTEIGVAAVLAFTWPIWAALLSRVLDLEAPDAVTVAALVVSLIGVALIVGRQSAMPDARDLLGMGAALITALSMSLVVLVSRSVHQSVSSATVNLWQSTIAAAMLAPFALAGMSRSALDGRSIAILFFLGAVLTGVGNTVFVRGMRLLSVPETAVLSYLEPVSATVLAALILAENPGPLGGAGMVLIVGAGIFVLRRAGRPTEPPALHGPSSR